MEELAVTWIKQMINDDDADTMPMLEKVRFFRGVLKMEGTNLRAVMGDRDIIKWVVENANEIWRASDQLDEEIENGI